MAEVRYSGKGPAERIADRLKPTCPEYNRYPLTPDAQKETVPTRTVTDCFSSGSQGVHQSTDKK